MNDAYGVYPGERIIAWVVIEDLERYFSTEEADSRIIPHIAKACQEEVKRVVVIPSDTIVAIYSSAYHQRFCEFRIQELWVKFGIEDGHRNIPIHKLKQRFCELGIQERWVKFGIEDGHRKIPIHEIKQQLHGDKCSALLKAYILTGCDETSKIGSEVPAMAILKILVLNIW